MRDDKLLHVVGASNENSIGDDEYDCGQRVLKLGSFHNDLNEKNFKLIYSSRDVNDPDSLSFHEAHFHKGRSKPFHHKHLLRSHKNHTRGGEKSLEEDHIHFLE